MVNYIDLYTTILYRMIIFFRTSKIQKSFNSWT